MHSNRHVGSKLRETHLDFRREFRMLSYKAASYPNCQKGEEDICKRDSGKFQGSFFPPESWNITKLKHQVNQTRCQGEMSKPRKPGHVSSHLNAPCAYVSCIIQPRGPRTCHPGSWGERLPRAASAARGPCLKVASHSTHPPTSSGGGRCGGTRFKRGQN